MRAIGIDVGGSAIKLGAVRPDGTRLREESVPIAAGASTELVFGDLARVVRKLSEGEPLGVIGLGVPGLLDRARGAVLSSPNLPWLDGVVVKEVLARELGIVPTDLLVENDANVAALGELWLGAARGIAHALVVTLGTGIGGGLILDGRLFLGEGLAGEIGHVNVDPDGPRCGCGSRGCLEALASATAARARALERGIPAGSPGDLELLVREARARPGPERALLEAIGFDLGKGLAAVVTLLDVRVFVIGGGFSVALDLLSPGIHRALAAYAYGERTRSVRVIRAALGASAGWIGAARVALDARSPA